MFTSFGLCNACYILLQFLQNIDNIDDMTRIHRSMKPENSVQA
jgi:hypothetical protein